MIVHGGTDAGPPPRVDASTNANPYGPSPVALAALRVDVGPYPDPSGSAVRGVLGEHHGLHPDGIVVGAGATELIDRLVRVLGGPVLTEPVTFGEYAGAAARHGHVVRTAEEPSAVVAGATLVFACSPGNPDGRIRSEAWSIELIGAATAAGTVPVWDLAYAPLVPEQVPVPTGCVQLHAPNKAHGCTGLRAGWLHTDDHDLAQRLRSAAVTWTVSAPGEAFLRGTATAPADRWVARHAEVLRADRDALTAALRGRGMDVIHGEAPFVLVTPPGGADADHAAAALRARHGVRVRPTGSQGLPGRWRVAALPAPQRTVLLDALDDLTPAGGQGGDRCVP